MQYYKAAKSQKSCFHRQPLYKMYGQTPVHDALLAFKTPVDALEDAGMLDCNLYVVEGIPVLDDFRRSVFLSFKIVNEISDQEKDIVYGFLYNEALHPIDPAYITNKVSKEDIDNLQTWKSIKNSMKVPVSIAVESSVKSSRWNSVWDLVRNFVLDSVLDSIWDQIWNSVGVILESSIRNSASDSIYAYIGHLFQQITEWKYVEYKEGYPFQPVVELFKRGFIPLQVEGRWGLYHPQIEDSPILMYEEEF